MAEPGGCDWPLVGGAQLRLLESGNAAELQALIAANREYLAAWLPWAAGQTGTDTLAFIARTRRQLRDNDGFQAAVLVDGAIAGVVGYHRVDWRHRRTSIGYWLAADLQGRGRMTAAVAALTRHALDGWGLGRVEIRAAAENLRSRAIPERLGFAEEATLHRAERVGNRSLDLVVYSLLAGS